MVLFFRNVTHLCNYWYLLYIERVLCTRKIFKLNLPRFWNYIHRGKNSCYSESLDSQLNLLWFDIIFSDIAKMTTNDSHIILHLLTLVFRVFRFLYPSRQNSCYSESLDSQLNLLWLISYLSPLWKRQSMIRTSYCTYGHLF